MVIKLSHILHLSLRGAFVLATLAASQGLVVTGQAQEFEKIRSAKQPLTLQARGSFMIGGDYVEQTGNQTGRPPDAGHSWINQMYVEYMTPPKAKSVSVIMVHGGGLTGKSYDTTPDGRMGWYEYFVRKGYRVFIPDQVSRGRSGFNQAVFNDAKFGVTPASELPALTKTTLERAWTNWRFGPTLDSRFLDSQFPFGAVDEFFKQGVPTANDTLPTPDPNLRALADLAKTANGAILIGHSQSGVFPLDTALLDASGLRGLVVMEPSSGCGGATYTDEQVKKLSAVPLLTIFGDHLVDVPSTSRKLSFDDCKKLISRLKAVGGDARMLFPPDRGIKGNTHMLMFDKNNDQIADLIISWIKRRASGSAEKDN